MSLKKLIANLINQKNGIIAENKEALKIAKDCLNDKPRHTDHAGCQTQFIKLTKGGEWISARSELLPA